MEKIKLGLFDIFGFIFPGAVILLSIGIFFLFDTPLKAISDFLAQIKEIPVIIIFVFVSYIVGYCIHQLGYWWYYLMVMFIGYWSQIIILKIAKLIFRSAEEKIKTIKRKHELLDKLSNVSEEIVLIRQFAPQQVAALDEWTSKRALSFNLSLSLIVLAFSSYYALKNTNNILWEIVDFFSIISSGLLLIRAYGYDFWWRNESDIIVKQFRLKSRKLT